MPKINVESFSLSQKLRRHLNHDHLPVQSNIQKRRQRTRYLTRLTTSRRKNSLRWKKMITSSQKSTKSGTNQVWDNTELVPHQQEDNGYLKYFNFYSIHIFHHLLWISHKSHHVLMRLCCKFNLYISCVQRNNVSQPNHIQLLFRLNFKLHIYFAVQVDNISY